MEGSPVSGLCSIARVPMTRRSITRKLFKWWSYVVQELDRPEWSGAHYAEPEKAAAFLKALEAACKK